MTIALILFRILSLWTSVGPLTNFCSRTLLIAAVESNMQTVPKDSKVFCISALGKVTEKTQLFLGQSPQNTRYFLSLSLTLRTHGILESVHLCSRNMIEIHT